LPNVNDKHGDLTGRVAVVTGAGAGIGRASAEAMARAGASVVVADIDADAARAVALHISKDIGGQAIPSIVDVADETQVSAMVGLAVSTFGGLHILHNNAAITAPEFLARETTVVDMDVDVWDRRMAVDLKGTMLGCKHAVPAMLAAGGGSIINMSSGAALAGGDTLVAYGSAKAGIVALTRYVATTFGQQGIRCNAISPGVVMTEAVNAHLPSEVQDIMAQNHLSPRFGVPNDVANAVVFLAGDGAAFINGQAICVDGGLSVHQPHLAQLRNLAQHG
jgi:NAD(P)-dependent dehydrogenase (short-subunit alcohol dehydrogenase family)